MLDDAEIKRGTIYLEDLTVGLSRGLDKIVEDADIEGFARISTDHNPVHVDEEYAQGTMFKGRIAHGMLSASLISAVLGEQLPGHGTIYLGQSLKFLAPVRPGDKVRAEVTVATIDAKRRRVTLDCVCRVGDTTVLSGEAQVLAPSRATD
ncbi:MAG: MaoC family dehydratase [Pseudomonadota bacterium]